MSSRGCAAGGFDLINMPSPGMESLTTILTAFTRDHPDVTVNTTAGFTPEEILDSVRSGASEIGVARIGPTHPRPRPGCHCAAKPNAGADFGPRRRWSRRTDRAARRSLSGCRMIVFQRGSLMRALGRRCPRRRYRGRHSRRSRRPHLRSAVGAQRDWPRSHPVGVDAVGAACRCTCATHRPGVLPARRRGQPPHSPDRTRGRFDGRGQGLRHAGGISGTPAVYAGVTSWYGYCAHRSTVARSRLEVRFQRNRVLTASTPCRFAQVVSRSFP